MQIAIILGIIIIAAVIGCILAAKQTAAHTFKCKSCSGEFKAKPTDLLFALHSDNDYEIHCPLCGGKGCTKQEK